MVVLHGSIERATLVFRNVNTEKNCKNCTIGDSTAASNEALNLTGLFPYAMSTVIDEISLPGETGE